ncbi:MULTISPECIES: LCP family glycopolymer transferase CpsA [Streptococcus]|uniref:LCP family protein n=1 Tax=Streptococcus caledonicus TaxID=2614158 RepID=A0ABW0UBM2_9STRE|nr:LCP family protein [Streptococcus sp. S784/96/1]
MSSRSQHRKPGNSSKHGFLGILNFTLWTLVALLALAVVFSMLTYNILAFNHLNLIIPVFLGISMVILFFWILSKKAKVIATVLLSLIVVALSTGLFFVKSALDFSNKLNTTARVSQVEMSVVVPVDIGISDVTQLNSVLAPIASDANNISMLLDHINRNKGIRLTETTSLSYSSAYESLLAGEDKAMVMNSAYTELLRSNHEDFDNKLKTIYTYTIKKKIENSNTPKMNSDSFNIYISGIDTYGSISSVSRSDVNIIMTVNQKTHKVLLTTTPRDSYVPIADGGNNQYDKLTHAGIYGVDSSIHTLENLYGINIDYYARINFSTFLKLIDLVGGVTVTNEQEFTSGNYQFPVGEVTMDSKQALVFVRERYSLVDGDNDRGKNQTKVIAALINKLTSLDSIAKYSDIINGLGDSIQTNMPFETMMTLANTQLETGQSYEVRSQAITGTGSIGELPSYAMPTASLYMLRLDESSLNSAKDVIKATMEGN